MKNSTRKFKSETVSTAIDSDVASDASVSHEPRDMLSEILRDGAQKMLQAAIHLEVDDYLLERSSLVDKHGHRLVVRNGSLPERELLTGLGPIPVQQPRVRDKRGAEEREVFSSSILPKYLRKTRSIEELVPWLYLKGISTNDFPEALQSLLGKDAKGLSATTITRLKSVWEEEYDEWSKRSLTGKRYVYMWADGIHSNIRFNDNEGRSPDENRQCLLVLMGATADGTKELIAVVDGFRESELSWREVLLDLKARGLRHAPQLAVGDGGSGILEGPRQSFPDDSRATLHGAQNSKRTQQNAKECPAPGEADPASDLGRTKEGRSQQGL